MLYRMLRKLLIGLAMLGGGATVGAADTQSASGLADLLNRAKAGDAVAQRSLAIAYESGYLVPANPEKARYWFERSAAAGDDQARRGLGRRQGLDSLAMEKECASGSCVTATGGARIAVLHARRGYHNHYFAPLTINGKTVEGLIDTGASLVSMSVDTARRLGISAADGQLVRSMTANGQINTSTVMVPRLEVAGIVLENVPVAIGITGVPLIGMSFLGRVGMQQDGGVLTLTRH